MAASDLFGLASRTGSSQPTAVHHNADNDAPHRTRGGKADGMRTLAFDVSACSPVVQERSIRSDA